MRILAIGDIVGENGVKTLKEVYTKIKHDFKIDFCIVNAENSAGGMGITKKIFDDIINLNINVITMGNHTWAKKDIFTFIDNPKIIRPANYSKGVPGRGYQIFECKNKKIAVINLIGRTDMNVLSENPFLVAEKIVDTIKDNVDISIIDFHAEATAEKIAMSYFLDGKVTAIFGTHTHVQTADERILPKGTGYISDIGMTGPIDSVIGMNIDASIKRFVTSLPEKYKLAEGICKFNGCIFNINEQTNSVTEIIRLNF